MGCCSPPGRNRTALSRDQCHPQESEHAGAFLLTAERLGPVDSAVGTGYSLPVPRLDETQPQGTDERSSRFRGLLKAAGPFIGPLGLDRKSTRLNSSHTVISYAVFCLKKKSKNV